MFHLKKQSKSFMPKGSNKLYLKDYCQNVYHLLFIGAVSYNSFFEL